MTELKTLKELVRKQESQPFWSDENKECQVRKSDDRMPIKINVITNTLNVQDIIFPDDLRAEAIKQWKWLDGNTEYASWVYPEQAIQDWIKKFFNLSDEDFK